MRVVRWVALFALMLGMFAPALVLAAGGAPAPQPTLAAPTDQVWTLIAGVLSPLVAYALNFRGPWVSEPIKALVTVVVAAIAGGIAQAVTAGGVGFNGRTLQFVVTAIIGALGAHAGLWRRSGIATIAGAGRNAGERPAIDVQRG